MVPLITPCDDPPATSYRYERAKLLEQIIDASMKMHRLPPVLQHITVLDLSWMPGDLNSDSIQSISFFLQKNTSLHVIRYIYFV